MRYSILIIVLGLAVASLAFPALAQERIPSNEDTFVPYPIPSDICVEIWWTEKSAAWNDGEAISIHYPPLDAKLRHSMKTLIDEGKATLVRCSAGNT